MIYVYIMKTKICITCGVEKSIDEYYGAITNKFGVSNLCIGCHRVRAKEYYFNGGRREYELENKIMLRTRYIRRIICHNAKKRAKHINVDFNLTKQDIIIPEFCPVFGIKLEVSSDYQGPGSPTLDRINNDLGYTKENVIIVSWKANTLKRDASLIEMKLLYENFNAVCDETNPNLDYYRAHILKRSRKRAREKKLEFNLKKNNIYIPTFCPILGIKLEPSKEQFAHSSPSIDRIDNNLGYVVNNIRIISNRANILKKHATFEEYEKLYLFYKNLIENKEAA
jgi:hypothetical protein